MAKPKVNTYKVANSLNQIDRIGERLSLLGLEGMIYSYQSIADDFSKNGNKTFIDYIDELSKRECEWQEEERIKRWRVRAKFPALKTLDQFKFSLQPTINKKLILDLATCRFIENGKNVIFFGPPGVGKTHLATGLGDAAINLRYEVLFYNLEKLIETIDKSDDAGYQRRLYSSLIHPRLLILDEIDECKISESASKFLAKIIYDRYENNQKDNIKYKTSMIFTSNVPFSIWEKLFQTHAKSLRIIDRINHNCEIINIEGNSYRIEENKEIGNQLPAAAYSR